MKKSVMVIVLVVVVSLVVSGVWADRPPVTVVGSPNRVSLAPGETATVDITAVDVQELYAYEMYIDYNPAVVRVVDADGIAANGVQVQLGDFVRPDLVITNRVDETGGRISVAVSQWNPTLPRSGTGTLFSVTFMALATGDAQIRTDVADSILTDRDAERFDVTFQDAILDVLLGGSDLYTIVMPCVLG